MLEIERKYLVSHIPFDLTQYQYHEIKQGYLSFEPELRIREKDDTYYLTKKSNGTLVRDETEIEISKEEYETKKRTMISQLIEKTRYLIPLGEGLTAELDIYHGNLQGLVAVEVEFSSVVASEAFDKPDWFGEEITYNPKYKNKMLSLPEYINDVLQ